MDKINYQGRQVGAELIGECEGYMNQLLGRERDGYDRLWQDAQGDYYVQRERWSQGHLPWKTYTQAEAKAARLYVATHRVSVETAILWAIKQGTMESHLRKDAVGLLLEQRELSTPYEAGDSNVTVPLVLPVDLYRQVLAMSAYDNRDGFADMVAHQLNGDVRMWLESGSPGHDPEGFLREHEAALDAGQHPDVWPPHSFRTDLAAFGWMDARACQLVGKELAEEPSLDVRDLLNGALDSILSGDSQTAHECAEAAKTRRLAQAEKPTQTVRIENLGAHGEPVDVEISSEFIALVEEHAREQGLDFPAAFNALLQQGCESWKSEREEVTAKSEPEPQVITVAISEGGRRFCFEVAATDDMMGHRWEGEYKPEQMPQVRRLAAVFGLSVEGFTRQLLTSTLPGQMRWAWKDGNRMNDLLRPRDIGFACFDEALAFRLERAAKERGLSLEAYVVEAIAASVDSFELEDLLAHPHTGEHLGVNRLELVKGFGSTPTALPTGKHSPLQARVCQTIGRKLVDFSVWLEPAQLERLTVQRVEPSSPATPGQSFLWVPLTGGVHPRLKVDNEAVDLDMGDEDEEDDDMPLETVDLPPEAKAAADRPDMAVAASGRAAPLDEDQQSDEALPPEGDPQPWGQPEQPGNTQQEGGAH